MCFVCQTAHRFVLKHICEPFDPLNFLNCPPSTVGDKEIY